jgi:hypothetical protein
MPIAKNWDAKAINGMAGNELVVSGEANTGLLTVMPDLKKHVPQGINPAVLLLDLIGASDILPEHLQPVQYNEKIGRLDQYSEVSIFYQDKQIACIKVIMAPVNVEG